MLGLVSQSKQCECLAGESGGNVHDERPYPGCKSVPPFLFTVGMPGTAHDCDCEAFEGFLEFEVADYFVIVEAPAGVVENVVKVHAQFSGDGGFFAEEVVDVVDEGSNFVELCCVGFWDDGFECSAECCEVVEGFFGKVLLGFSVTPSVMVGEDHLCPSRVVFPPYAGFSFCFFHLVKKLVYRIQMVDCESHFVPVCGDGAALPMGFVVRRWSPFPELLEKQGCWVFHAKYSTCTDASIRPSCGGNRHE